jgi:hypothetical protein
MSESETAVSLRLHSSPLTEQGQKEEKNDDDHKDDDFGHENGAQDSLANHKIRVRTHVGQHQEPLQGFLGILQSEEGAESGERRRFC